MQSRAATTPSVDLLGVDTMGVTQRANQRTTGMQRKLRWAIVVAALSGAIALTSCATTPQSPGAEGSGEANLQLPDLGSVDFLGLPGDILLGLGLIVCALGLVFGIMTYRQLSSLPVHQSMREISELI